MTSEVAGPGQADAPVTSVGSHRFRPPSDRSFSMGTYSPPKSAFIKEQECHVSIQNSKSPGICHLSPAGKPPGGKTKKMSIYRSASSDAIHSNYLPGEWLNVNHNTLIRCQPSQCIDNSPLSIRRHPPSSPKPASPGTLTKSHLNLWPIGSLFKKRLTLRSSFKKLCQGSTEGLNQELEKLTLTTEDAQRLQHVPDGHRAPVQELLDMFCDSPPMASSSGTSDSSSTTPSHLPLLSTLSSSSSSPPPPIASGAGEVSSDLHHQQLHRHHRHYHHQHHHIQSCLHRSILSGSPEVPTSHGLGLEIRQVKPLKTFWCPVEGCHELMVQSKLREDRSSLSSPKYQNVPSSMLSSVLSCSAPHGPLLSPVSIRANIPSNESAFASYPTLPKSFKIKDSLCHGSRALEGLAGIGNS